MTAKRRTAPAASALAIVTLASFVGGCGTDSNQAACRRALFHIFTCGSPSDAPPEFDFFIPQICASVPETSECDDWPAFADCLTSFSCADPLMDPLELFETFEEFGTCDSAGLEDNGCLPALF